MLKLWLLLPLLGLTLSCASYQPSSLASGDFKDFRQEFALENRRLHESLKYSTGFSFMSFSLASYQQKMKAQNERLYREIQTFEEIKLGSSPSSFVICVKSEAKKIAICDNSGTAVVDRVKVTTPLPDLNQLMDEIRGP